MSVGLIAVAETVEVTVGIDIGTTSVKAVAVDADGGVQARTRIPHAVNAPSPAVLEHDADAVWNTSVVEACDAVSSGHAVAGIGLAAMVPSLAAVDAGGAPISPGILYGDHRGHHPDGEFVGFLRSLEQAVPDAHAYWPAQAVASKALCGAAAIDAITAMTCLPVFSADGWDPQWCDPARLPELAMDSSPVGHRGDAPVAAGFVVRHHLDVAGATAERIVAAGGGTHVDRWMQTLADATNLPVDVAAVPEGAARGAAWLARISAGLESGELAEARRWARTGRRVEPRPDWAEAASRRYPQWRSACDARSGAAQ